MEDINEQTELNSNGAEKSEVSQVSLGKFKDVDALLKAYNSLQTEFTKRCQKLKELELAAAADKVTPTAAENIVEEKGEKVITDEEKNEILKDYLKSLFNSKQKAVLIDGAGVGAKTPADKPKSIAQAGALAKQIFK